MSNNLLSSDLDHAEVSQLFPPTPSSPNITSLFEITQSAFLPFLFLSVFFHSFSKLSLCLAKNPTSGFCSFCSKLY